MMVIMVMIMLGKNGSCSYGAELTLCHNMVIVMVMAVIVISGSRNCML